MYCMSLAVIVVLISLILTCTGFETTVKPTSFLNCVYSHSSVIVTLYEVVI